MSDLAKSDHEQVLETLAHDLVWQIGSVMDERGDDLSRIGKEAQDVTHCPENCRIVIIIKQAAMPPIAVGEGVGAVEVVKHRKVRT